MKNITGMGKNTEYWEKLIPEKNYDSVLKCYDKVHWSKVTSPWHTGDSSR